MKETWVRITFSKLYFYFRLKGQTEKPFAVIFIYGSQRPGRWSVQKKKDGSGEIPVSQPGWWQTEGLMLSESPAFYECVFVFAGTTWEPILSVTSCAERGVCFPSLLPPRPPERTSFHHLSLAFEGRVRKYKYSWLAGLGGGDSHTLLKCPQISKMFYSRLLLAQE